MNFDMQITARTQPAEDLKATSIALGLVAPNDEANEDEGIALPRALARLDRALDFALSTRLGVGDFRARAGQTAVLHPGIEGGPERVQLIGLGPAAKADGETMRRAAARASAWATDHGAKSLALFLPAVRGLAQPDAFSAAAEGVVLGAYRFDRYKSGQKASPPGRVQLVADRMADLPEVRREVKRGRIAALAQCLARDLSNEPPNELPPAALAREARKVARSAGLRCKVLAPAELAKRDMNALLAVGAGSAAGPRLIVLEHRPKGRAAKKGEGPLCIVGKGITFDSGGLSLKSSTGMIEMKHDMAGAATVVGLMKAVGELDLPVHVVGIVAAAENMPSGNAARPGDVVRAMSGKTIEILNTDAEGRVVLADALHYANVEYAPSAMIDVATLTGAVMMIMGPWATAMFSKDDDLVEEIREAGDESGELMWPLPLLPEHSKIMKSRVADLKNTGGSHGGGSTAAAFLAEFAGETPWVHLDIAGSGMTSQSTPYHRGGGTGVGVRTLLAWIQARSHRDQKERGRKDGRKKRR